MLLSSGRAEPGSDDIHPARRARGPRAGRQTGRDSLRSEKILQQRLFARPNVTVLWNQVTEAMLGTEAPRPVARALALRDALTGERRELPVDGVFVGPSDLAASMGHLGSPGHPEVKAAVEEAIRYIAAAGKAPGVFSADPAAAESYRKIGARFLLVGVDALLLRNAAVALAGKFKPAEATKTGVSY